MFSEKKKCCLTCTYWNGSRKTVFQGKEAACNISRDTGNCSNKSSIKQGKAMSAGDSGCIKYEKWNQLK